MSAKPKITIIQQDGEEYKIRTIEVRERIGKTIIKNIVRIAPLELRGVYNKSEVDFYVSTETIETVPSVITNRQLLEEVFTDEILFELEC